MFVQMLLFTFWTVSVFVAGFWARGQYERVVRIKKEG